MFSNSNQAYTGLLGHSPPRGWAAFQNLPEYGCDGLGTIVDFFEKQLCITGILL
jgi:hypothetical protein